MQKCLQNTYSENCISILNSKMITIKYFTEPGPATDFENEYISNLIFASLNKNDYADRTVYIFSSNIRFYKFDFKFQKNDIFLHLSNENLRQQYGCLYKTNVVLRSYYNPLIRHDKCFTIPLGYQTGFRNSKNLRGENNTYMWSFIGQMKSFRQPMYSAFKKFNPHYTSFSEKWNSMTLSFDEVKQIYLNTAFAPCPFGSVHADTIRIMEVLEWGCIPVVVHFLGNDYFRFIYGNHPFISARTWDEAAKKSAQIFYNKTILKEKQEEVRNWYQKYKSDLTSDIASIVSDHNYFPKSSQFKYQKQGKKNILLKLCYYYHFHIKTKIIY